MHHIPHFQWPEMDSTVTVLCFALGFVLTCSAQVQTDNQCNQCCQGPQGPAGTPGTPGTPGVPGQHGLQGPKGETGDVAKFSINMKGQKGNIILRWQCSWLCKS